VGFIYLSLFEESGYEVYETVGLVEVGEDEGPPADGGRVQRILELRVFKNSCRISFIMSLNCCGNKISVRRSSELSVASGSIACAIKSTLLLTFNWKILWRQFDLWNYRFLG
jgi:hypothetical protein